MELIERQRKHWKLLHTKKMYAQELELWIDMIPYKEGVCNCQKDIYAIVAQHPPRFDDWERWTWEIHNVVNTKLGKQLIAWTDAITLWNWPIKDIPSNGSTENAGKNTS